MGIHVLVFFALKGSAIVTMAYGPSYPNEAKCEDDAKYLMYQYPNVKRNAKRADHIEWRCEWRPTKF